MEMQSQKDALKVRISEAEGRVSDIDNKMLENKEAEKKRKRPLLNLKGRHQDLSNSISEIICR